MAIRAALIVASSEFDDPKFQRLRAPTHDTAALGRVLRDPNIGGFDVQQLVNESAPVVHEEIEGFFTNRKSEDLLLLYFSCHGMKDQAGRLYFVMCNTKFDRLASTGVSGVFVQEQMDRSDSKHVIVLLDCCYSGAFMRGMAARSDDSVHIADEFQGRGRVVITASTAMEYAWEGDLLSVKSEEPSIFTRAVVHGLDTGEADRDNDQRVSADELYQYVHDRVREQNPNQTPMKVSRVEGDLFVAKSPRPRVSPTIAELVRRGDTASAANRSDAAQAAFDEALKLDPNNADALRGRGLLYGSLARYEESVADLGDSLQLEPNNAWALCARGLAHYSMGRYEDALTDFDETLKLEPDNARGLRLRGWTYLAFARYEQALADFDGALRFEPHNKELLENRTFALKSISEGKSTSLRASSAWKKLRG